MTQFSLKLLALVCMLADHFAKVILPTGVLIPLLGMEGELWLETVLEIIGRIAFPIFAWFLAEGCRKTGNLPKYLLRLLTFGVLSEIPFQLCFGNVPGLHLGCHNVIFTMLLGALGIYAGQLLMKKGKWLALLPALAVTALGWFLYTDYNAWGVALILVLYYLPENKPRLFFLAIWVSAFYLIWHGILSWPLGGNRYGMLLQWLGGLTAVLLLATYHGQRGRACNWLFYGFYPVHLALLFGLRVLLLR